MDFNLSEEHKLFRESVRAFAKREMEPLVEEAERKQEFPKHLIQKAREAGFLGVGFPEEYGGHGGDLLMAVIMAEELARVCSGMGVSLFAVCMGPGSVLALGTDEQKKKYLPPAMRGEKTFCLAVTEPNAGSDVSAIETTAKLEGDHYVLNGRKIFITNGTFADYAATAAYVDKSLGLAGMRMFLVDTAQSGYQVVKKMDKLGHLSAETAEIVLDNVKVPKEDVLGEEGKGFINVLELFDGGRVLVAGRALGVAQAAYDLALNYAKQRVQFGRPISKFQVTRFKLARMAMEIDAARLLTYRAAWMVSSGQRATKEVSMAKLFAAEVAVRVADEALQIHGGYGYIKEFPIERIYRDARLCPITEGTSEIHHIIIARELGL